MKKALANILNFALLLPAVIGALRLSTYFLELEKYKAQCKNRNNTEITCNGLCKLSEELSLDVQDKEPSRPLLPAIENILPLFYCEAFKPALSILHNLSGNQKNSFYYQALLPQNVYLKLEKPPTVG